MRCKIKTLKKEAVKPKAGCKIEKNKTPSKPMAAAKPMTVAAPAALAAPAAPAAPGDMNTCKPISIRVNECEPAHLMQI